MQAVFFVLALPALLTPFVSFTYGTSPLDVLRELPSYDSEWTLYFIGATFFAAFPIVLWKARRFAWPAPPPGRRQTRALAGVALIVTAPAIIVVARMLREVPQMMRGGNFRGEEIIMLSLALITLVGGTVLSGWRWRRRGLLAGAETLLVVGYVTITAMCLYAFHDGPQLGYWLTVPATASFAAEALLPRPREL
jgi:hypothetical protein